MEDEETQWNFTDGQSATDGSYRKLGLDFISFSYSYVEYLAQIKCNMTNL